MVVEKIPGINRRGFLKFYVQRLNLQSKASSASMPITY